MRQLVESVPNISEGRDQAVISKLLANLERIPKVAVLDVHVDPDHHRSVFTIVGEPEAMPQVYAVVSAVVGLLLYYVVGKFVVALVLRYTTNGTSLVDAAGATHRLGCKWSIASMLGIYVSNLIAIVFSLGLLTPWAQMRILKYQLDNTWIDLSEPIEGVVATQSERMSSLGEEIGDVFDVDIGL